MSSKIFFDIIYLIGHQRKFLFQRQLPSNKYVLSLLICKRKSLGKPLDSCLKIVIDEVCSVWNKTGIPMMNLQNGIANFKKLYNKWTLVKKSYSRTQSSTQKRRY